VDPSSKENLIILVNFIKSITINHHFYHYSYILVKIVGSIFEAFFKGPTLLLNVNNSSNRDLNNSSIYCGSLIISARPCSHRYSFVLFTKIIVYVVFKIVNRTNHKSIKIKGRD